MNSTAGKLSIGLLTLLPNLIGLAFLLALFGGYYTPAKEMLDSEDPVVLLMPLGGIVIGSILVAVSSLAVVVYYFVHLINNKRLDASQRLAWASVVLIGGSIGCMVYWLFQIWREEDDFLEHKYTS